MTLRKALAEFERSGCFQFHNDQLSANGLMRISESLTRFTSTLQCNLHHIQLLPFGLDTRKETQVPLIGAITNQEYSPAWCDKQTDFYLHQLSHHSSAAPRHYIEKNDFKAEQQQVEGHLLNLFYKSKAWESINLDSVVFSWKGIERSLVAIILAIIF